MFFKKKNKETFTHEQKIERAKNLHAALVTTRLTAHEAPDAVIRLAHLYREVLKYDANHFQLEPQFADPAHRKDSILMLQLLGKYMDTAITPEDVEKLKTLNGYAAAEHLRDYLLFAGQAEKYARKISEFLILHKREISVKVEVHNGQRKTTIPDFYKYGYTPGVIEKVLRLLKNIEKEMVPLNLIKIFKDVFDVYARVDLTKSRPEKTTAFYQQQLKKMEAMTFAALIVDKKVRMKKKVIRKKRKSHAPSVEQKLPTMSR